MKFNEQYKKFIEATNKYMTLYHGGKLKDGVKSSYSHKSGRWEHGPGLYLTTHYDTAAKYSKGSRKLYKVTIEEGTDLDEVDIESEDAINFINKHVMVRKRDRIIERIDKYTENGKVPAYILLNNIINDEAVRPSKNGILREFLVEHGVDYSKVSNAFGWGEMMIIVFNFDKVINIEESKDSYEDLPFLW